METKGIVKKGCKNQMGCIKCNVFGHTDSDFIILIRSDCKNFETDVSNFVSDRCEKLAEKTFEQNIFALFILEVTIIEM